MTLSSEDWAPYDGQHDYPGGRHDSVRQFHLSDDRVRQPYDQLAAAASFDNRPALLLGNDRDAVGWAANGRADRLREIPILVHSELRQMGHAATV